MKNGGGTGITPGLLTTSLSPDSLFNMSYRSKILGNSFFYGLAGYQETIVGMLVSILVARQLGAEEFGRYSLMMWFVALGVMLASGGVVTSIIKFVAEQRNDAAKLSIPLIVKYNLNLLYFKLPISIMIVALLLLFIEKRLPADNTRILFWIVLIAIVPKSLQAFYTSVLKGVESFKSLFFLNSIVTPINLFAVLFVVWKGGGIYSFVYLYLGITTIYYLVSRYYANQETLKATGKKALELETTDKKNMDRQIKFLYLIALLGFFVDRQMEVFFLNIFATPEAAGYYNVAFMLSVYAVELIPGILVGVLLPVMAKSRKDDLEIQAYRYREVGRYLMLLTAPVIVFVAAYADVIIEMLYGHQYRASAVPLAVLVVAAVLAPLAGLANSLLVSHERQKSVLKLIFFTAILNIVLDYFLIKMFALNGAIIGFSVVKLGLSASLLFFASKVIKSNLDYLYYSKVIALACVAVAPLMLVKDFGVSIIVFVMAGLMFVITFFVFLVQFRMLTKEDVNILRSIKSRVPKKYENLTGRILSWMEAHQV
jgi:O-antigen/teichoic acid export membrane protein